MNSSGTQTITCVVTTNYTGLRLKRPINNCFIHAALNSIVTNKYIIEEVNNPHPFHKWYKETLEQHKPEYNVGSLVSGEDEIRLQIQNFFRSSGCTALHGRECFERLKKQYLDKLSSRLDILQEMQHLVRSHREDLDTKKLILRGLVDRRGGSRSEGREFESPSRLPRYLSGFKVNSFHIEGDGTAGNVWPGR